MNTQKLSTRTKAALWLLIAPTALWVVVFILWAVINWGLASLTPVGADVGIGIDSSSVVITMINVAVFILALIAFISWLPGLITGIVLLATRPKQQQQPPQVPPTA